MSEKGRVCAAWGCENKESNNAKNDDGNVIRFHKFPSNTKLALKWRQNLRNATLDKLPLKTLKKLKVCSYHFKPHHYTCPERRHYKETRLNWNAVPSIIDCPNPPPSPTSTRKRPRDRTPLSEPSRRRRVDLNLSNSEPTSPPLPSTSTAPLLLNTRRRRSDLRTQKRTKQSQLVTRKLHQLRCRVSFWKNKCQKLRQVQTRECPMFNEFPSRSRAFLNMQLKAMRKAKSSLRWTPQEIEIGLSLYHSGPKAYRFLRNELRLALPSHTSLKRRTRFLMRETGSCPSIMASLAKRVMTFHKTETFATLSIDGMHLTPSLRYEEHIDRFTGFEDVGSQEKTEKIADEGIVAMLRGISTNWKQPIAHYFVSKTMKQHRFHSIIMECLRAAHDAGVKVIALVCDQESTQWALLKKMVTSEHPYFNHPSTGDPVYVVIDIPHCLKNTRNALKNYDISFEGKRTARWEHVLNLFIVRPIAT